MSFFVYIFLLQDRTISAVLLWGHRRTFKTCLMYEDIHIQPLSPARYEHTLIYRICFEDAQLLPGIHFYQRKDEMFVLNASTSNYC